MPGFSSSGLASQSVAFFAEFYEPEIELVDATDVFVEKVTVGVVDDGGFVVTLAQLFDDMEKFVDLGMHDTQIANDPDFVNIQGSVLGTV
jgi:hypothetical protein